MSTILIPLDANDPEYATALQLATPGRILLDIKRNELYKARGVKQGFKEDKELFDGPDFNYYAHVAKLTTVRSALLRYKRGNRRICLKDVSTAFLRSKKFPEGKHKYICFKNPISHQWEYYKQTGPIYGEDSAPKLWEDTFADFLENTAGMDRGKNEPCVFHRASDDLSILVYVDDLLIDGDDACVRQFLTQLAHEFDCNDPVFLGIDSPIDFIGIIISLSDTPVY